MTKRPAALVAALAITACADATSPDGTITVASPNALQVATRGASFTYDASQAGATFAHNTGAALTYRVAISPAAPGLSVTGATIVGTPTAPGVSEVVLTATDANGRQAADTFELVVFREGLSTPTLSAGLSYIGLPAHYANAGNPVIAADNAPANNAVTNAGATLGRVLFYDRRLSRTDNVSCSSCHAQGTGFADTARLSRGFAGGLTGRHSMGLANARFYNGGRFFWDERAATLEAQVLQPIQDTTEMGLTLTQALTKLRATSYYAPLFTAAFGSADITSDRVARALAQFVRSIVSTDSKFDRAFAGGVAPNFAAVFTQQEIDGLNIFNGPVGGCSRCHGTNAHISDAVHNTGLDPTITDIGAGQGRFKSPSLRNVAVRAPYMHDGRFATLDQVVAFYDSGVQPNPALDPRLRALGGAPIRLNLTAAQRASLVAFLHTLTDSTMLTAQKFADPFAR
jgi:cytochrome c peroxidase